LIFITCIFSASHLEMLHNSFLQISFIRQHISSLSVSIHPVCLSWLAVLIGCLSVCLDCLSALIVCLVCLDWLSVCLDCLSVWLPWLSDSLDCLSVWLPWLSVCLSALIVCLFVLIETYGPNEYVKSNSNPFNEQRWIIRRCDCSHLHGSRRCGWVFEISDAWSNIRYSAGRVAWRGDDGSDVDIRLRVMCYWSTLDVVDR